YGFADESVIEAVKSPLPHLLDSRFSLCRSTQDVVAQERNKGHRDKVRAQQRNRHHHWEALQELTGIACKHQKWQVGDNIRDCRVKDCCGELCRAKPTGNAAPEPFRQVTFDAIS